MWNQDSERCNCSNCPTTDCQCGCQSMTTAVEANNARPKCDCGAGCGCESAEQGCLCHA